MKARLTLLVAAGRVAALIAADQVAALIDADRVAASGAIRMHAVAPCA
jgi:hypothetical protein